MMDATKAVRELRSRLGDSQHAFANRLGLTVRAIAFYEKDRVPSGNVLRLLAKVSEQQGFSDLATVFRGWLADDIGSWDPGDLTLKLEPQTPAEKLWVSSILAVLRNERYASLVPKLARLLREPAENSIKVLEAHKSGLKLRKEAIALLDQGRAPEEISKALDVPLVDIRVLSFWREMQNALDEANKWARQRAEEKSK
jgi:transcriptional regulator with XRE-family HTH domain